MDDKKKALANITQKKSLTKKNRKFIEEIIKGTPIHEAYRRAGYNGKSYYAPYELKRYLKNELLIAMEANGISEEAILIEARNLLNKPLDPNKTHLSFKEKMQGLEKLHKMLPKTADKRPTISPVIIQRGDGPTQINIGEDKPKKEVDHDASI